MQLEGHARPKEAPDVRKLAYRAIATARHIGYDAIKYRFADRRRQLLGPRTGDEQARRPASAVAPHQRVDAPRVGIIGHNHTRCPPPQQTKHLLRLAARCRAHVEYGVMRLQVQQQRW